jgi:hypothetical protein
MRRFGVVLVTERLTNRDDVGNGTANSAKVVGRADEVFAAAEERDANGHDVAQVQENDTNTVESVESGVRTEVNRSEDDLTDKAADHAVERHTETLVDLLEPVGSRHGAVASESPNATGGRGCARDAAEDSEQDDGDGEDESASLVTNGRAEDDRHGLCVRVGKEGTDVREDKDQRDEEDKTEDSVHDSGADHGLGDLSGGRLDFLRHGDDHAGGRGGIRRVEHSDNPRPAGNPSRIWLKCGEDIFCAATAFLGDGQDGADDGKNTDERDVHGGSLRTSQYKSGHVVRSNTYVQQRQMAIAKRRNQVDKYRDGKEDEVDLVVLGVENASRFTSSISGAENVNAANEEESGAKVHGQGDGDVSEKVRPATNPGKHTAVLGRRDHECLVVDTTGSRVDRSDLTERSSDGNHDQAHGYPSPNDVGGTATIERVDKGSGQTVRYRGQDTGHEHDLPC